MTQFDRTFNFMKKPVVIISYIILVVLAYLFADETIASYCHMLELRDNLKLLKILTAFGQWAAYMPLFFLGGLYFRYIQKNKKFETMSWYLLACVLVPNIVGAILKVVIGRARPDLLFESLSFGFYWFQFKSLYWSFPSGHTITVIAVASGLGVLFPKHFYSLLALALCVAMSRILLYHHYLSDVMTGFYISIIVVGLMTGFLRRKHYLDPIT
jgi:membrane-associated phospholipid phosphatase